MGEADTGVSCPACGHSRVPTLYTRRKGGASIRVRVCANCSQRFRTSEQITHVSAPAVPARGRRKSKV